MHGFFYFASGIREPHPKHDALVRWGLGYAFDDNRISRCGVIGAGPNGKQGVVFSLPDRGTIGYYPDQQTWRKIPAALLGDDAPELWVGCDKRHKLTPDDLARPLRLKGHDVRLADGQTWTAPAAVVIDTAATELSLVSTPPRRSELNDQGQWVKGRVLPQYEELIAIADDYWRSLHAAGGEGGRAEFDFADAHDKAAKCLAVNYRLGQVECSLLGLLDETVVSEVLLASIDWPTIKAWTQKKTEQGRAGGDSSAGRAA